MSLADWIIVMNRGRIEQIGTPDEIYMKPRTAFVASFIGRTNWFHGRITGKASDGLWRLVTASGTALTVKNPGTASSEEWQVCIRPERIAVKYPQIRSCKPGESLLHGEITGVVNMGAEFHYVSETADGRILAIESNRRGSRVKKGDRVSLLIRAEDCVLLPRNSAMES